MTSTPFGAAAHSRATHLTNLLLVLSLFVATSVDAAIGTLYVTPNPSNGDVDMGWTYVAPTQGTFYVERRAQGTSTWTTVAERHVNFLWASLTSQPTGTWEYRVRHHYMSCGSGGMGGMGGGGCTGVDQYTNTVVVNVVPAQNGVATTPVLATVGAVGTTAYEIDVDTKGNAIIGVPLDLIPGVAEFAPALTLEYDSGRGIDRLEQSLPEDTLGYGWRLTGLSEIRRCVVDQAATNAIGLTDADSLCLDGMPLVLETGTHLAHLATYRTLMESYAKVRLWRAGGTLYFTVTLPDGTVREYGNGPGSRVDQNGGVDYAWSLSKETSTDGNVINYTYYHDVAKGINYVVNIDYTDAAVEFKYRTRTDASAVAIGSASQTQSVFLHTVRVKYDGTTVREYRLLDEVVASRRRLHQIQQCGYAEDGTGQTCLAPLDFDWMTPSATMAGVPILVDGMLDGLGAVHQIEFGTITGSSHPFLFTERPYGNGTPPANTQALSGTGALRHVATKLRRDNGLGGFHDTSYAYQEKGLKSTKHWGFLGFYAQRITDAASGIVTYGQYRLDYPYFGQLARLLQYDDIYGSATQTIARVETDYAQQSIAHSIGTSVLPYASESISFIFEGSSQLGATKATSTLTLSSGFISQLVNTDTTGTTVSSGSAGSIWGDIPTYTVSGLLKTSETTTNYTNRTTSGQWLIGFANSITNESWPGPVSGSGLVRDATMVPDSNSNRLATTTRFPNDSYLTLSTTRSYDASGRPTGTNVSGDNVTARSTSFGSYTHDRYPGTITNAKGHVTTISEYDSRFGLPKEIGDPNGQISSWVRDQFGRVTNAYDNYDNETETAFLDCSSGCGFTVYGIAPTFRVQSTSPIAPTRIQYFDNLGRLIRSELEAFTGLSYSKQDIGYDGLGRVEKVSLPYYSGTPETVVTAYDIRSRVATVTRPDGSSTSTVYSVTGNTLVETVTENVKYASGSSAGSQVKRNEYNVLGQLTKTTDGYGTSINPSITYTYDAHGNPLTAAVNGGAAGTVTTTFEYDLTGNQRKRIDPDSGTTIFTYTALNELRYSLDAENQAFNYTYDTLSRLTQLVTVDGTSTWTWDDGLFAKGKLKTFGGPGFTETYTYNSKGQVRVVNTQITAIGESTGISYVTQRTFDANGRTDEITYPNGLVISREYNAQGYLERLKSGSTILQEIESRDAFGNIDDEFFANGVSTTRLFNAETGLIDSIASTKGATVLQDNAYDWRSNGTLESRTGSPVAGLSTTRRESIVYDVLNRVAMAETFINSTNTRDLAYTYDLLGNIKSKTSTLVGDTDVTGYAYGAGAAGAHAVTSATINGVSNNLTYDANGAVTRYDIVGTTDDKFIAYNAFNQPRTVVIGSSLTDTTPVAKDEFAYDPIGRRIARKTTWVEGGNTYTEKVSYAGATEFITDNSSGSTQTVTKVAVSPNVMHVTIAGATTEQFFEYAHHDHLGSIDVVTDASGNVLDRMAFEPFGSRKAKDWSSNISTPELAELLDLDAGHSRKARGFTAHEHLDRTGLIHMNGRVYDPTLGRFLSPDPIVQLSTYSQNWNRYSYVDNSPTSVIDPTGFKGVGGGGDRRGGAADPDYYTPPLCTNFGCPYYLGGTLGGPRKGPRWTDPGPFGFSRSGRNLPTSPNNSSLSVETLDERWYETNEAQLAEDIGVGIVEEFTPIGDIINVGTAVSNERYWTAAGVAAIGIGSYLCLTGRSVCKRIGKKVLRLDVCCFVAGTLVATEDGLTPIDEIEKGDLVLSRNPDTGETELKPVVALIRQHEREIWEVEIRHADSSVEVFETTDDHPWWIEGAGWIETVDLRVGQEVTTVRQGHSVVSRVELTDRRDTTYNISVADFETYFVGNQQVLVHNKCGSLRNNLGDPPSGLQRPQAHHDLPQADRFKEHWERAGLDNDNAAYGRWVEGGPVGNHQKWSAEFNREWDQFFERSPNATREQILEQMEALRSDPRFQ